MSRAQRRASRASARTAPKSRRIPARPRTTQRRIPWVPIGIGVGVIAVAAVVVYLVWQANQPASEADSEAARVEANASKSLPGEWVNLPKLYGDGEGYPKTANHVQQQVDYESVQGLPPVGGDHWGDAGECPSDPAKAPLYCGPVPAGLYPDRDNTWEAESVVHNLEHAGVVVWYNTDDQRVIDELRDFATDHGLGRSGANVTLFYPEMEEDTVAITTWSRRLVMTVDEFDREKLEKFYDAHECRFDPEGFC